MLFSDKLIPLRSTQFTPSFQEYTVIPPGDIPAAANYAVVSMRKNDNGGLRPIIAFLDIAPISAGFIMAGVVGGGRIVQTFTLGNRTLIDTFRVASMDAEDDTTVFIEFYQQK